MVRIKRKRIRGTDNFIVSGGHMKPVIVGSRERAAEVAAARKRVALKHRRRRRGIV
jgi:hypothetical protein